ncbi:MAG: protein-disulfide reductase DsbD family protein, partial [Rhodospirillales bacterium]|nr:protein-disulfide reductase DsbD family protein [Rhodospirillales bacterium]
MKLISLPLRFAAFFVVLVFQTIFPLESEAGNASSETLETDQTSLRLIAASEGAGEARSLTLGLHFKLKPGWKVYWRSPGDAGYPPSVEWSGSENFSKADMLWPAPHRFSVLGLETLGYKDEVVYPITYVPAQPGAPVKAVANVDYLTCNDICIPYQAKLTLELAAVQASPSQYAHLINRYAVQVPGDGAAHGVSVDKLEVIGRGKDTLLRVTAN